MVHLAFGLSAGRSFGGPGSLPQPAAPTWAEGQQLRIQTQTKPSRCRFRHPPTPVSMLSRAVPRLSSLSTSHLSSLHRSIHSRVPLDYPLEAGVGTFLSPKALKTVAVDWQEGVLNKLNTLTRGTFASYVLDYGAAWRGRTAPSPGDFLLPAEVSPKWSLTLAAV